MHSYIGSVLNILFFSNFFTGILKAKRWAMFSRFKNPTIKKVLKVLPDVIQASRQKNTIKVYLNSYSRFENWAKDLEELSVYPSNDLAISIYLLSLIQLGKSMSVINQFIAAANWIHKIGGYPSPTQSSLIHTITEGAKRTLGKPVQRKEPITPEILKKVYKRLLSPDKTLTLHQQRTITFMVLAFSGFLRCKEALKIKRSDIAFHTSYLALFLESSKTDKYRAGRTVLIARTGTTLDPVFQLYKYLNAARIKVYLNS